LAFEPKRTIKVAHRLDVDEEAVESFSAVDWNFMPREVALLVLSTDTLSIGGAVLMERMHGSGGTGKLKMRLSDPVVFAAPISEELVRDIAPLANVVSTADRLTRISDRVWTDLVVRIKELRSDSATALDHLLALREQDRRLLGDGGAARRLMEERDALGMALEIGELNRRGMFRKLDAARQDQARSILDLLDAKDVLDAEEPHEQDLLRHDERIFQGLLDPAMRHARFVGPEGRSVRVRVYDGKPLETVTGIDLLIYQEAYGSYLLLQYKAMTRVGPERGGTWSYDVDDQTYAQLDAMAAVKTAIQQQPAQEAGIWDWRLHESPFYFKYCEKMRPQARDESLVHGIILDADHLRHFLQMPESRNRGLGHRVGYDNCPRYLNNSQFVELARYGWIGCGRKGYAVITELVRENKRGGKRAMLAVLDRARSADASGRRRR
jgi:hypothetical protein